MRVRAAVLLSLWAIVTPVFGDDDRLPVLKVGDDTYHNVLVLRVTATDIYFTSDNGIGNAKIANLEPALQSRFAPDATRADEVAKKDAEANTQYEYALALKAAAQPAPAAGNDETATPISKSDSSRTNKLSAKTFLNQKPPPLEVEKWISASPVMEGRFILFEFWSPANAACVKFITNLDGFQQQFGEKLTIIGISSDSEDDVRKIVEPKIDYSSAIDTQKRMESALELKELPYMLTDPSGIVRWEGNPLNSTNTLTEAKLSGLLNKYASAQ